MVTEQRRTKTEVIKGEKVIAIDGKTARHSFDTASGKPSLHLVSAYSCREGLTLGQVATNEKSNEITAIPELIDIIDIRGSIVTIDAMGCQKSITKKIRENRGNYILTLKKNHADLLGSLETLFQPFNSDESKAVSEDVAHTTIEILL